MTSDPVDVEGAAIVGPWLDEGARSSDGEQTADQTVQHRDDVEDVIVSFANEQGISPSATAAIIMVTSQRCTVVYAPSFAQRVHPGSESYHPNHNKTVMMVQKMTVWQCDRPTVAPCYFSSKQHIL